MSRRHRTKQRDISTAPHGAGAALVHKPAQPTEHFRHALLGAAAAILVARPLVPSDGGAWTCDGQVAAALWIALAALWAVQSLGRPRLQIRFGWIDATMVAFVGWWSASALIGASHGAPRPSINMLWEGVAILLAFLLLRQLVEPGAGGNSREARALVAVMIAVGVLLAIFAIDQYFVTKPAERRMFAEHPEVVFREAPFDVPAPGTPEFRRLADRFNSPEPTATFNLTNSLAAYLAPWLVIAIGIATLGWCVAPMRGRSRWKWLRIGACAIPIGLAMGLTHSRSASIGTVVGCICLAIWRLSSTGAQRFGRSCWILAIAATIMVIIGGAVIAVRPQFLEPARALAIHSFQVRLDYWRATRAMIADRPWLGCGPGNFADYYTQYKLPAATEEIRDPHNFALEIATNAGLPALALFVAVLAGFAYRLWRNGAIAAVTTNDAVVGRAIKKADIPQSADGTWWILGGAILGIWVAVVWRMIAGFAAFGDESFVGTFAAGATWWLLWPWIRHGTLPPRLCGVGVLVLLIALLAVGGITFGGVNETLWLLLVLGLNATDANGKTADHKKSLPWFAGVVLLLAVVALWFAQRQTAYEPTLGCERALDAALVFSAQGDPAKQEQQLLAAAEADPYAVEPRRRLAQLRFEQWQNAEKQGHRSSESTKLLGDFEMWMDQAIKLEPQSAALWGEAGNAWRRIFAETKLAADGRKAVEFSRRAAELYPTGVTIQLELADALSATGDSAAAKDAAREAVRLDDLRPKDERALTDEQRNLAERIILGDNRS